jgi:hypothetical protein
MLSTSLMAFTPHLYRAQMMSGARVSFIACPA